jgi:dinuclear metal center YbgI/SA1388 family protein
MKIAEIIEKLASFAPPSYQEDYDNSGLIIGNAQLEVTGVLISLDCIESVVDEAISLGCNLVISHHPIVFKGLKQITGKNYVERTIIKAIQHNIAIYAAHTNLDHVNNGVNLKIAEKIGLINCRVLHPKSGLLKKLVTFCPINNFTQVQKALFDAGCGHIGNYSSCSFQVEGEGNFKAENGANPYIGKLNEIHTEKEVRLETIFPSYLEKNIIQSS